MDKLKACYIHIPFCKTICTYCDFCKMFYNKEFVKKYLVELERQIVDVYDKNDLVPSLYIGGGTPSSLDIEELEYLFKIIKDNIRLTDNCEVTIEANFDSITYEKLDLFKKNGINRISFGLESIDKDNLELMGRVADKDKVIDIINYCNKIGLNNINVDLMYALPNEDMSVLDLDIQFIKSLPITHVSTYSLILEEHTKLYIDNVKNIDCDLDREMYDYIVDSFKDWDHYEISNFAKDKEYESKHNLCYWKNKEYYGFGLGASSFEGNVRYSATRSINKYLDGVYTLKDNIEYLNLEDKMYYEVILGLRTRYGVNLNDFKNKYNKELVDVYDYTDMVKNNMLEIVDNSLVIPSNLWYISNSVIVKLLESEK